MSRCAGPASRNRTLPTSPARGSGSRSARYRWCSASATRPSPSLPWPGSPTTRKHRDRKAGPAMLRLLILLVSMLTTRRPGATAGPGRPPLRDRDPRDFDTREFDTRHFGARDFGAREREAWEYDSGEDDRWEEDAREGGQWYPRPGSPAQLDRPPRQVIRGQLIRPSRRRR